MANPKGKGGFKPGRSGNPYGRPKTGFQTFRDRLAYWLETKTAGEIEDLLSDKKKWKRLLSIDAIVVQRIHGACQEDGLADFVAILDRFVGKPVQPIAASFDVRHGLAERIEKARRKLLEHNTEMTIAQDTLTDPGGTCSFSKESPARGGV